MPSQLTVTTLWSLLLLLWLPWLHWLQELLQRVGLASWSFAGFFQLNKLFKPEVKHSPLRRFAEVFPLESDASCSCSSDGGGWPAGCVCTR